MSDVMLDARTASELHRLAMASMDWMVAERRNGLPHTGKQRALSARGLVDEIAAAVKFLPVPETEPTRCILFQSAAAMAYHAGCWTLCRELIRRAREGTVNSHTAMRLAELEELVGAIPGW